MLVLGLGFRYGRGWGMIMGRDRSRSIVRNKCKGYSKGKYMVRL